MNLEDAGARVKFVLHDLATFTAAFDALFQATGVRIGPFPLVVAGVVFRCWV